MLFEYIRVDTATPTPIPIRKSSDPSTPAGNDRRPLGCQYGARGANAGETKKNQEKENQERECDRCMSEDYCGWDRGRHNNIYTTTSGSGAQR